MKITKITLSYALLQCDFSSFPSKIRSHFSIFYQSKSRIKVLTTFTIRIMSGMTFTGLVACICCCLSHETLILGTISFKNQPLCCGKRGPTHVAESHTGTLVYNPRLVPSQQPETTANQGSGPLPLTGPSQENTSENHSHESSQPIEQWR